MAQILITQQGLLSGLTLDQWDAAELTAATRRTEIEQVSFYRRRLDGGKSGISFRGITFKRCGFGHSVFSNINFINCRFESVDLTRTQFRKCLFSQCKFVSCDPYYAVFPRSDIDPSSFAGIYTVKGCYTKTSDYNKATVLFSNLRTSLLRQGDTRKSKRAEYYLRVWDRKKLWVHAWKKGDRSLLVWLQSLFLGGLNGYGERPQYTLLWMIGLISAFAGAYGHFSPTAGTMGHGYLTDWYFSFRVFFAQAFGPQLPPTHLLLCQLVEFGCGLILVAVFIGSTARKLSA